MHLHPQLVLNEQQFGYELPAIGKAPLVVGGRPPARRAVLTGLVLRGDKPPLRKGSPVHNHTLPRWNAPGGCARAHAQRTGVALAAGRRVPPAGCVPLVVC